MEGSSSLNLVSSADLQYASSEGSSSGTSFGSQQNVNLTNQIGIPSINRRGEQLEHQMKEAIRRRIRGIHLRSITASQQTPRSTSSSQQAPPPTTAPQNGNQRMRGTSECLRDDHNGLRDFLNANPQINPDLYMDCLGNTLLLLAAGAGAFECVKVLVGKGVNVNVQNLNGETPIFLCARGLGRGRNNQLACLKYLLEKGALLDKANVIGAASIHQAAKYGFEAGLEEIIKKSPESLNLEDHSLLTAVHYAVLGKGSGALQILITNEAGIEQKDTRGLTPFLLSFFVQNSAAREFLIENGANLKAITNAGDTAIQLTVIKKDPEALKRILRVIKNSMEADEFKKLINAKDKMGFTAHDLATSEFRGLLKEWGAEESFPSPEDVKCRACLKVFFVPQEGFCGDTICRPCLYKRRFERVSACPICDVTPMRICGDKSLISVKEEYIYKYFEKQVKERLLQGDALDCLEISLDQLSEELNTVIELKENWSFPCQVEGLPVSVGYMPSSQQLVLSSQVGTKDGNEMIAKIESLFAYQLPKFANVGLIKKIVNVYREEEKTAIICQVSLSMPFASQETVRMAARGFIALSKTLQAVLNGVVDNKPLAETKSVSIPHMGDRESVVENLNSLPKDDYAVDFKGGNIWEIQVKDPNEPLLIGVEWSDSGIQLSCPILDHVPDSSKLYQAIPVITVEISAGTPMLSIKQSQLFLLWNFSLKKTNWDTFYSGTIADSIQSFIKQVRNWKQNFSPLIKG